MIAAIADIHAYSDKLFKMLTLLTEHIDFDRDTVVFLGDYIDGGPDAKEVLDTMIHLQKNYPHWQFLLGNHEDMMLAGCGFAPSRCPGTDADFKDAYYLWWNQGGEETLESYRRDFVLPAHLTDEEKAYQRALLKDSQLIPTSHLDWIKSLPTFYETDSFYFVHAGVYPGVPLSKQSDYHRLWIRSLFINSDWDWGKRIIFGHTYHSEPVIQPNKIGIDLMTHGYGDLCAVIFDDEYPDHHHIITTKDENESPTPSTEIQ